MTCGLLKIFLIDRQHVILQGNNLHEGRTSQLEDGFGRGWFAHNFFIVTELETVLNDMIFILLDLISIEKAFLHFLEVPSNNKWSG